MALECNKCCFCIDLRTGCLIIGYLNLIGEFIMILLTILSMISVNGCARAAVFLPVAAVALVFYFHYMGFTIVLLVGLHQYKRGHVKAYLIYGLIFLVLYITVFIISTRFIGKLTDVNVVDIVKELTTILLNIYLLLTIRSYHLKMDDPAKKPAIYNTA